MPIPSYPEWFQVYVAPARTDRFSVSVSDNASLSNTLDNNTAIASLSSSAVTKTPSKNTSENNTAVASSSPSSSETKASSSSSNTSEDNIVIA